MATLKEVAKLAKVDSSVVSRVVNNDPALNIKPETRKRILDAVEELKYRPNMSARNLKKGQSKMLGMIIPDFSNPVYSLIIHGAEDQAAQEGFNLLVYSLKQKGLEKSYSPLLDGQIEGLLIANSEIDNKEILELKKTKKPFMLVNRTVAGVDNYVVANDLLGAKLATKHLIKQGHHRIAHISGPLFTATGLSRFQGYREGLQEDNIDYIPVYVQESKYTVENGYESMEILLDLPDPPTAVFASNIMICLGAMKAIQDRGLTIPKDMSIIGVHDVFFTSTLQPPLTTVKMPLYEMGREAVKKLIAIIQGKEGETGQGVTIDGASLIVRSSTSPPPSK
ncbi:LacI family DNA-binding transcriptional regulator [Domibacillus enclensis]|uniref:Transcriptional regulator, LacI family n=1 Tax=Domibacillus enclensis TaxID=1017273 RepID=A0A1N6N8P9_9BACI|nr:LacI family DNA-binding transcriptional regulator [Domibacillus enclensis]SIP88460.1 transcriptional regulator, LacI family [Domibacillus enclensis]